LKKPSTRWILASIILLGIALRLYLLFSSQVIIEADEALVGLQAFGILRGERPIFYPGQVYGGSLESYLVAAVFQLLGASPLTLKLIPFLFSTLFIFMTYQLAKEIYNPPIGLLSALFVALCPLLLTAFSLKTWGGYSQTPVLGNLALILLQRILSRSKLAGDRQIRRQTAGFGNPAGANCDLLSPAKMDDKRSGARLIHVCFGLKVALRTACTSLWTISQKCLAPGRTFRATPLNTHMG
jgi:hypothetical protein